MKSITESIKKSSKQHIKIGDTFEVILPTRNMKSQKIFKEGEKYVATNVIKFAEDSIEVYIDDENWISAEFVLVLDAKK